jgi:hypothetical protein
MDNKTMVPTLQLDLNAVTIDVPLAQRVPYALSRYYLALPLGQDNGSVSVAMAYPENAKAQQVLSRLLRAQIVPVFTPTEQLLPALERVYGSQNRENRAVLAWYMQPEWETAVMTTTSMLSETLHISVDTYSSANLNLNEVFTLAATGEYELIIVPSPAPPVLATFLDQVATPLFFVRGEQSTIKRILLVMRGFASDERTLDWLTPFAWSQQATITLLPLVNGSGFGLGQYLHQESSAGQHLDRCLRRLHADGITVNLKFRQGNLVQQVVEEISQSTNTYDLLAIAAEDAGDFVHQVISAVDQNDVFGDRPIFVLKPPERLHQPII